MADDPRDGYLFTVVTKTSFTFSSPEEVRRAALEMLDSERFWFMSDQDRARERERVEASLSSALLLLAGADGVVAGVPGVQTRASRLSIESGGIDED